MRQPVDPGGSEEVVIEDLVTIGEEIGFEKGREEGLEEGKRYGFRFSVLALCQVLDIEVDDRRRAALQGMSAAELEALLHHMGGCRRWE